MGMGVMPAGIKREVVADSVVCKASAAAVKQYPLVSVDFCAAFRRATSPAMGPEITPLNAMHIFQKWMKPHLMGADVVVYAIDRPHRIPERRWQLYKDKKRVIKDGESVPPGYILHDGSLYKEAEAPADPALADKIRPDCMPVSWAQAYNTPRIKAKLWDVCMESLKLILDANGTRGLQYVIMNQDESVVTYPPGLKMPTINYGEGDQLAVVAAKYVEETYNIKPAVIITNDIDITLIQMLRMDDVSVCFRTFTSAEMPDTFTYDPSRVATRRIDAVKSWSANAIPAIEIMTTPKYLQCRDIVPRLHIAMLILCASKTDYCAGIFQFGWSSKIITNFIKKHCSSICNKPWLTYDNVEGIGKTLTFNARGFQELLWTLTHDNGGKNRKRCRNDNILDFTRVIHDMLFTLRYWAGFDKSRIRGGPPLPNYEIKLFPDDMDTVTELVTCDPEQYDFAEHTLRETHP